QERPQTLERLRALHVACALALADDAHATASPPFGAPVRPVCCNAWRKPSRQLDQTGCQPSSRFALVFAAPRPSVIHCTAAPPASSRPSQAGTRSGGFAPTISARYGSHLATRAGSSSVML